VLELLLLALALSADAFAVSLVRGAAGPHRIAYALDCGAAFGFAQGVMALLGWSLGELFAGWIAAADHWIAFGLLALLGVRMIGAAFSAEEAKVARTSGSHHWSLAGAALATSVDAAAAGLALELFATPVWLSCVIIGVVTALVCTIAYWFASRLSGRLGRLAEAVGGIVLIVLGVQILVEHLGVVAVPA
jgi:putative Mn2+ efflux pump MntP